MSQSISVSFSLDNEWNNDSRVKEFDIIFKKTSSLDNLLDFLETYEDKRVNISFPEGINYSVLKSAARLYDNIAVKLHSNDIQECMKLKDIGVKYYFDNSYPAVNLCSLDSLIALGVSDVYLADDLCYNLERTYFYCHTKGIKVRMILNRIPSTVPFKGDDPKSPIWMPRDIDSLEKYVDIFEFDNDLDDAYFDVMFRTWFEKKAWNNNIREINLDLNLDIYDDTMLLIASIKKMKCGRRCSQRAGNVCDVCGQMVDISTILHDKGVRLVER